LRNGLHGGKGAAEEMRGSCFLSRGKPETLGKKQMFFVEGGEFERRSRNWWERE